MLYNADSHIFAKRRVAAEDRSVGVKTRPLARFSYPRALCTKDRESGRGRATGQLSNFRMPRSLSVRHTVDKTGFVEKLTIFVYPDLNTVQMYKTANCQRDRAMCSLNNIT